jgi:acetoin:2,6-dichlorophenolindophenol oxidoreductase subunit beta
MSERELAFHEALNDALDLCLALDPRVYLIGLGVPDPKGLFGSTAGLAQKHGRTRVRDMPTSENGMTGIALGSALVGMRPILSHQRVDFSLLAMEQMVNQMAKWHYMFGSRSSVPVVIRMIVGRGWGQGPQHSQSLHAWFCHVPGLKVVMPATPADAKGLLVSSVEDDNPVIFVEHRWCYGLRGPVPAGVHRVPIGVARIVRSGEAVTIAAASYAVLEALRAAERLASQGISAEVVDLRTVSPLDTTTVLGSVAKTGHLVVADTGTMSFGIGAEIVARVVEAGHGLLKASPKRVGLPDCPSPSSPALANAFFPGPDQIVDAVRHTLGLPRLEHPIASGPRDVPDPSFSGPF